MKCCKIFFDSILLVYYFSLAAVEGQELAFSWTPASGAVYRCTLDNGEEFNCEYGLLLYMFTSELHVLNIEVTSCLYVCIYVLGSRLIWLQAVLQ